MIPFLLKSPWRFKKNPQEESAGLTVLKVEPVEVHSFNQVAEGFGLKGGQSRVADLPEGEMASRVREEKR